MFTLEKRAEAGRFLFNRHAAKRIHKKEYFSVESYDEESVDESTYDDGDQRETALPNLDHTDMVAQASSGILNHLDSLTIRSSPQFGCATPHPSSSSLDLDDFIPHVSYYYSPRESVLPPFLAFSMVQVSVRLVTTDELQS